MKIIVEGLPEGQKIKSISVDITFEDGDMKINKKVQPQVSEVPKLADVEPEIEPVEKPQIDTENRVKKEIPKEMTDIEL